MDHSEGFMRTVARLNYRDETNLATQSGLDIPTIQVINQGNMYDEVALT